MSELAWWVLFRGPCLRGSGVDGALHPLALHRRRATVCVCVYVCPLLAAVLLLQDARVDEEAGAQALMLSRVLTLQDPFQGFPFTTTPGRCDDPGGGVRGERQGGRGEK